MLYVVREYAWSVKLKFIIWYEGVFFFFLLCFQWNHSLITYSVIIPSIIIGKMCVGDTAQRITMLIYIFEEENIVIMLFSLVRPPLLLLLFVQAPISRIMAKVYTFILEIFNFLRKKRERNKQHLAPSTESND